MEIFTNPAGRVDYFPQGKIVMESLYGQVAGQELREVYVAGLECARERGSHRWLSESRSLLPLAAEDVHWINWTWFPQMKALGWSHWAIIRPASPLASVGMQDLVRTYEASGVEVAFFDGIAHALEWLRPTALAACGE